MNGTNEPYTRLYVHCVWATWDRRALIVPGIESRLHAMIAEKCRELRCHVFAVGGTEDHVHLLVGFPARLSISDLMQKVKGVSSHLANDILPGTPFKWQRGYGAFTLGRPGIEPVTAYIENQKSHHCEGTLIRALERCEDTTAPEMVADSDDDEYGTE